MRMKIVRRKIMSKSCLSTSTSGSTAERNDADAMRRRWPCAAVERQGVSHAFQWRQKFHGYGIFGDGDFYKQEKKITTIEARDRFILREIGSGCGLIEYTKSYRSLCDSDNNDYAERTAALKAYRAYVAGKVVDRGAYATVEERKVKQYSKECQIPPAELPPWCRLWNIPAPQRC